MREQLPESHDNVMTIHACLEPVVRKKPVRGESKGSSLRHANNSAVRQLSDKRGDHNLSPLFAGRGRREAPGERLSEESSCIGVCGTRIACFCVKADEQLARQGNADDHFFFSSGNQPGAELAEAFVVTRGSSGNQEQD